jgi:hypothetical protein
MRGVVRASRSSLVVSASGVLVVPLWLAATADVDDSGPAVVLAVTGAFAGLLAMSFALPAWWAARTGRPLAATSMVVGLLAVAHFVVFLAVRASALGLPALMIYPVAGLIAAATVRSIEAAPAASAPSR